jgi:hypothetical protein
MGNAFGDEYVSILNRSQLVFNYSVRGEANMRLFEAMACGAVPLVEEGNVEVPLLFQENEHYFTYDPHHLEDRLDELFSDPDRIARVARSAQDAVSRQTLSLQLARLLKSGLGATRTTLTQLSPEELASARVSQVMMRLLGVGYSLQESLVEARLLSPTVSGLERTALVGLLLNIDEADTRQKLSGALTHLIDAFLENKTFPSLWGAFFHWQRSLASEKKEAPQPGKSSLSATKNLIHVCATWAASGWNPGYRYFVSPVALAGKTNLSLNRCFQAFIETGRHDALLEWMENQAHEKRNPPSTSRS